MKSAREGLIVSIRDIPPEGLELEASVSPAVLEIDPAVAEVSPIKYRLRLILAGKMALVRGRLETVARQECSRCLAPLELQLVEPDLDASLEIDSGDETIDLTSIIRDYTLLALPEKPLCSPSCRGLCPWCGKDLNKGECSCAREDARSPFSDLDGLLGEEEQQAPLGAREESNGCSKEKNQ